jgi:hypothetical protein
MGFFQNALNFVNEVVIPVFKPAASHANSYYQTAVHPHAASALSEGGEYFKTAVIPAMETALSQAGDFVQTAALPAATFVKGNIEHAKELSLQVWEGSAGGQSLKDIVMPALDIISPALDFVVKNPWILLPILVPALEAWLLIIGFGVNGIVAGKCIALPRDLA